MTAVQQNFTMYAGETKLLPVTVYGQNVNLVGSTIVWVLRQISGGIVVTKSTGAGITIDDGTHFTVTINPWDTHTLSGPYGMECKLTDTNDNVTMLFTGEIEVLKNAVAGGWSDLETPWG